MCPGAPLPNRSKRASCCAGLKSMCAQRIIASVKSRLNAVRGMRLVVVEDDTAVRALLRIILEEKLRASVVKETDSITTAAEAIWQEAPDIVIIDRNLAGDDGFDLIEIIRKIKSSTRIVIFTSCCDDYTVLLATKLGVDAFIDKGSANIIEVIAEALDRVCIGGKWFCEAYLQTRSAQQADPSFFGKLLSDRECLFVELAGLGSNDDEIGLRLGISRRTAQTHRSRILHKLRLDSTPKLIRFAIDHGFVHFGHKAC